MSNARAHDSRPDYSSLTWTVASSYRIITGIQEQNIHVLDRQNLRLQSGMCTCDTSELLQLDMLPSAVFPKFTFGTVRRALWFPRSSGDLLKIITATDEELDEIFQHLCYARAREPTAWRRFIVVVNEADPNVVERGRSLGVRGRSVPTDIYVHNLISLFLTLQIEVHTWTSLSALVKAQPFG